MSLHPDFINELAKRFTGEIRLDLASRILYSTDASMYQIEPLGVAIPKTQEDLHAAVGLAAKYKIPILPRGSGSSLGGQAIGEALILDCSRWLDSIIAIDPESHTATVEPGVVLSTLNRASAKYGLMFGPDPASAERATMGGMIGNNATGAHSILYGMSVDHLLEADVILSDGSLATFNDSIFDARMTKPDSRKSNIVTAAQEIREKHADAIKQHYPKSWRNSAGYRLNYLLPWSPSVPPQWGSNDYGLPSTVYRPRSAINMASLLAGSEGTLAVIRHVKVNLVRKPKHTILGVLAYNSIADACDDVPRLLEFRPSAIELIPRMIIQLARGVPAYASQMGWLRSGTSTLLSGDPAAVLVVEFSGDRPETLKEAVRHLGDDVIIAESVEDQAHIWNVRKVGLGILDSRPQSARPAAFIEDCAVPVEHLGEFVREVERILTEHKTVGGIYAHASGGCLHIRPILDLQRGDGVRALRSIGEQTLAIVLRLGGSMTSEHGDGIVGGEWIEKTYGAEVTEAMRMLKRAADPDNILNPGKMFDAPPFDSHLRYGENYRAQAWTSSLHFEHERGLAGAIEHCNGQGVCRKDTGVMCPSFQATRDEANSTRGRANLLRALIASPIIENRKSEIVNSAYSALDLCLACKGCASECPSGVDMPKLKYEFMNEYYKTHRRQLRDYLFGYFHIVSKLLSPVAPLANAFMKMDWSRKLIARVTGITDKRPFPAFALSGGSSKTGARLAHTETHSRSAGTVLFLSDVFSHYLESEIEQAAFDVLHVLGYDVKVLPIIGAGTSLLSKGFIKAARRHAEKVLAEIKALDGGAGLSVVGCEPPEVYCLKYEYTALLPERRAEIESIAKRVWSVDEFVLRVANLEKLVPTAKKITLNKIVFHPHCHQRAEGLADDGLPTGTAATVAMLRAFGFEVDVLEAGCCGMAGTFGYDAEHYELSMQVGELGVLPKIRQLALSVLSDTSPKSDLKIIDVKSTSDVGFGGGWVGVVTTGSACRMQIRQGTGVEAKHPLVLIAGLINSREE
jgi:FAD/FMN-containing dehydrogenase/Fe-S oxidoreductase